MSEIFGYLIVEKDVDISTLPYENEEYTLLPGSIAYVVGGGAYMLTPSNMWQFLDPEIQKVVLPVFKNVNSSGGGGGGGGGGDCNLFPVTITVDYDNPISDDGKYPFTADKTFAEIAAAIDAGKTILIREDFGSFLEMNVPTGVFHEPGSAEITFSYTRFSVGSSSTWTAANLEFTLIEGEGNAVSITEVYISVTSPQ